jgi:hypothetical protein
MLQTSPAQLKYHVKGLLLNFINANSRVSTSWPSLATEQTTRKKLAGKIRLFYFPIYHISSPLSPAIYPAPAPSLTPPISALVYAPAPSTSTSTYQGESLFYSG